VAEGGVAGDGELRRRERPPRLRGRRIAPRQQPAAPVALDVIEDGPGPGEFSYQLRRAVRAGDLFRMRWEVVAVEPSEKLGGEVVTLAAEARDGEGRVLVSGTARILVKDAL